MLEIRLLGPPTVTLDGHPVTPDTRKAIAILAYLLVQGPTTRDTLTFLFWGDSPPERARGSLRRTLSSLRSTVGIEHVLSDRATVDLTGPVSVDIHRLNSELQETHTHAHPRTDVCDGCISHLENAVSLARGEFLEGFSVRGAPEFEHWVRGEAESFRSRIGEARQRLAMAYSSQGDYGAALVQAKSWIELDPLHEPAHRLSILLSAWSGDRPGAVEAYFEFVATLDRELGVPPLEETTELYEAILDEDLPPTPLARRQTSSRSKPKQTASRLFGRDDELTQLRDRLSTVSDRGQVVRILGSSWMGKTRLIEELSTEAEGEFVVVGGRSFRMEQEIPYGVAVQLLSPLLEHSQDLGLTHPEWVHSELARIDPRFMSEAPPGTIDGQGGLRLLEAARDFLSRIAKAKPVLLSVDDVQWIDEASALLLAYLVRRVPEIPVFMLFAWRDSEPVSESIAAATSAHLEVHLSPLGPKDIAAEVSDNDQARSLLQKTGGVPMLVLEALEDESSVSGSVLRYMESRLEGVGDLARQVLAAAAVLSGMCGVQLLRAVSGRAEEEVVSALEDLVRAELLREIPETGEMEFTLDSLESLVYDSLTMGRRRLLHRRAGEVLIDGSRTEGDLTVAAAIANQFQRAGDGRAPVWFHEAGDLARRAYANSEARLFYEAAIALGSEDLGNLHRSLGELAMAEGRYQDAMQDLTAGAAHSEGADLALVNHRLGECCRLLGRFSLAFEYYEQSLAEHPFPSELYADWSLLAQRVGDLEKAFDLSHRAVDAVSAGDQLLASRAHNVAAVIDPEPERALIQLDRALEFAGDHQIARMAVLNNMAYALGNLERHAEAIPLVLEAIDQAHATGFVHREAVLRNHLAELYYRVGRVEYSEREQVKAMGLFSGVSGEDWQPEVWLLRQW